MTLRVKSERKSFERKRAKSAILKTDFVNAEDIEMSKGGLQVDQRHQRKNI
jgi:hypothetical protein